MSGATAGRALYCTSSAAGAIIGSSIGEAQTRLFDGVEPGDEVQFDDHDFLAYCYYYRHHATPEKTRRLFIDRVATANGSARAALMRSTARSAVDRH